MATRNLDKNNLSRNEDCYGNNAAVVCPVCGQTFVVSAFINKGQRQCPKCKSSGAEVTMERVAISWPDSIDEVHVQARKVLESKKRLEEFIKVVEEGGAVRRSSIEASLPKAEKIAFIERNGKMVAVAAIKRADPLLAATLTKNSGYQLFGDIPELGYIAVSPEWRNLHLSSKVVDNILVEFGAGSLFATTSELKIKCVLAKKDFRWVGTNWPSTRDANKLLSLWIREAQK